MSGPLHGPAKPGLTKAATPLGNGDARYYDRFGFTRDAYGRSQSSASERLRAAAARSRSQPSRGTGQGRSQGRSVGD